MQRALWTVPAMLGAAFVLGLQPFHSSFSHDSRTCASGSADFSTAEALDGGDSLPRLRDRGIGYVIRPEPGIDASDTVTILASPSHGSPVAARFIVRRLTMHTTCAWLEARAAATRTGVIEVGYEVPALAMDTLIRRSATESWALVLYGYDAAGRTLRGWTAVGGLTKAVMWPDHFAGLEGLLLSSENAPLVFRTPGGVPLPFTPERNEAGWIDLQLMIHGRSGHWLDVTLSTPADCTNPGRPVRTQRGWVRVTSDEGRPAFWYFTRGC